MVPLLLCDCGKRDPNLKVAELPVHSGGGCTREGTREGRIKGKEERNREREGGRVGGYVNQGEGWHV